MHCFLPTNSACERSDRASVPELPSADELCALLLHCGLLQQVDEAQLTCKRAVVQELQTKCLQHNANKEALGDWLCCGQLLLRWLQ